MPDVENKEIQKAESTPRTVTTALSTERGQPRIVTSSRFIQDTRIQDLKMPTRLCTFDQMCEDDAIANSIDITNLLAIKALSKGKFKSKGTPRSDIAANFLNYCIRNMSQGTWMDAMTNACTDLKYGFSFLNIVTEIRQFGPFAGQRILKKLAPRDQKSVYGWVWDNNIREFRGFVQRPNFKQRRIRPATGFIDGITELTLNRFQELGYPFLRANQLLHFSFSSTNNNPQGNPLLEACYRAWKEKLLIERYEVIGVSKDLGGAIVLRVPSELVEKANQPDLYPEQAKEYKQLQEDAAKLHAGESSYIVLTSDVDPQTNAQLFDFELKGIDGGGKQYRTSEIIDQKRKSIYNVFGTGFLLLGQNSEGSYALSTSAVSTHGLYVGRHVDQKVDVINNQLAPRLLAVNDIFLDFDDMPEFEAADPQEIDLDTVSKVVQRMKSVGGLTQQALTALYESLNWPIEGIEDLVFDDGDTSRGAESNGTSGVGSTQAGGASSATNAENGGQSVTRSFVVDYETDDQIVAVDMKTGEPIFIEKE